MNNNDETNTWGPARDAALSLAKRLAEPTPRQRLIPPGGYEVGYGKPPREHQFQPGTSGNPGGRPVGSRNKPKPTPFDAQLNSVVLQEFYRPVTLPVGGEVLTLAIAEVGMRSLMARAAKGSVPAMRLATELAHRAEAQQMREHEQAFKDLASFKFEATRELERRKRLGLTDAPPIYPHPDQIHFDPSNGTFRVDGPWSKQQEDAAAMCVEFAQVMQEAIAYQIRRLKRLRRPDRRAEAEQHLATLQQNLADILESLPEWALRMRKDDDGRGE